MKKIFLPIVFASLVIQSFGQNIEDKITYGLAFDELHQMLKGEKPLSFKRAVFITENAYVNNQLSYEDFSFQIDALVKLTKAVAATDGLDYTKKDRNQVLLAGAIYRVMKDSLVFESPDKTVRFRNVPFTYDMEDFWGEIDWTKMFVTKLLYEQTGNCHSLPALYKIIAEEVGVDAWLAIAPNHTYIKQWSDKTGWYNTELTTGRFPFDGEMKHNSYVKTEAIAAGVYMDTLSSKETISYVITDLAQGYVKMFGYNDIATPVKWLDTALVYYPDYPNAMILRAELLKKEYEQVMKDKGATNFSGLLNDPPMKEKFDKIEQSYYSMHQVGYRRMPKQMYLNWLFRVRKDTTHTPYKFKSPQPFKQYNYNVRMLTAGDGENYEFFDQEEIVRIGTIEINRLSGKIVKFIELEKDDMPDEVISRMYDPALGRFWQVDPMAEKRYWVNPYNFVQNNPINRVDPSGLTDFALNKKTGAVTQVGEKNDDPDRIVKTDKNGNVKKKGEGFLGSLVRESKRGEAKVAVGGIEKGILKDGANFQNNHNVIGVGGEGQPTVAGVRDFALKLSNYVGKEVGGYYLANKGETSTSYVAFGPYKTNDAQTENSGLRLDLSRPDLLGKVNPTVDWHTHLSRFGDNDRLTPSYLNGTGGDVGHKQRQLTVNPSLRFIIITNQSSTDTRATELEY
jgi:RHS repeat-associated protein